jgi:hypothetical protein
MLPTKMNQRRQMSDSFVPGDCTDEQILEKLISSAQVLTACVLELRKRNFNIESDANYWMAAKIITKMILPRQVADDTMRGYVNNLGHLLRLSDEQLPANFSITKRIRLTRQSDRLNLNSQNSKTVHDGGSHSSGGSGGGAAVAAEPKKVTLPFFVSYCLTFSSANQRT